MHKFSCSTSISIASKAVAFGTTSIVSCILATGAFAQSTTWVDWAQPVTDWFGNTSADTGYVASTPAGGYISGTTERWDSIDDTSYLMGATGSLGGTVVTLEGEVMSTSCFNGTCTAWNGFGPQDVNNANVASIIGSASQISSSQDMISHTGYVANTDTSLHTLTFKNGDGTLAPQNNVVLAIFSLGDPDSLAELLFTNDFEIVSYSSITGAPSGATRTVTDGGYKLSGYETDAYIRFLDANLTSITWQVAQPEFWFGFNVGVSTTTATGPTPGTPFNVSDLPAMQRELLEIATSRVSISNLYEIDGTKNISSVFDGGELVVDRNLTSSHIAVFKIRNTSAGRGKLTVDSGLYEVASVFENFDGSTTGGLEKVGTGTLRLTADSTYTGATVVSAGTLDLAGSLTSDITVASAGTLKGYGSTSGGLTSSGTVSPGNSPGTLSVAGPVVFNSTNNFVVELDGLTYDANGGAGTYDRLAVTGTASTDTFTAGGTLTPVLRGISAPANNDLVPVIGDTFRVVTTGYATGVSGAFTSIADPDYTDANSGMPTNTRFDVLYGGNYVDLVLTPDDLGTFAQAYGIQNMVNAAEALDAVRPVQGTNGTTDKDQFFNGLYGLTATQFAQALLQASGEIHAFALSDARDGWQSGVGVVRSASQDADRNYWLDVSGYDLSFDQDSIASSYDGTTQRLWVGTDIYQSEQYVLGVAVGVSNSDISTVDTGSAETKTTSLALYMNGSQGSFEYDGILSVNRSEIDTTRTVDLRTGALTNTSTSTARGAALTAQVGYRYDIEEAAISSLVWLRGDVDATKADGFVEDGSTVTALTVAEQDMRSAELSLGYTISGEIPNGDQPSGTWNLGIGASKTLDTGMPYVTRTMSLHGATWDVSVPQSGDVAKFASAGIDLPVGEDASMWLNVAASERDGALAKSAAFGFQVQW